MTQIPLRTKEERRTFCDAYFESVGAICTYKSKDYCEYELPRDIDKELTDRPYYWMWVEHTNQDVPNTILRLAFTEEARERENARLRQEALAEAEKKPMTDIQRMFFRPPTCEFMALGCFRLDKIYQSLDERGRFCCVAPRNMTQSSAMVPWLFINATVSYRCDSVEQTHMSLGVCLKNGQVVERFHNMISNVDMTPFPASVLLKQAEVTIDKGFDRIQNHLEQKLRREPHDWAADAEERLEQEIRQIQLYYRSILPDTPDHEQPIVLAEQSRKEAAMRERSAPRIEVDVHQVGLVGLVEKTAR